MTFLKGLWKQILLIVVCLFLSVAVVEALSDAWRSGKILQPISEELGISVYSNFDNGQRVDCCPERNITAEANYGIKWQCVELTQRYYHDSFGYPVPFGVWYPVTLFDCFDPNRPQSGRLVEFYDENGVKYMEESCAFANKPEYTSLSSYKNANNSTKPVKGDIVVFSPHAPYKGGHVAIVSEMKSDEIVIAEQNWGLNEETETGTRTLQLIGNEIKVPSYSSWKVEGWITSSLNPNRDSSPPPEPPQPPPSGSAKSIAFQVYHPNPSNTYPNSLAHLYVIDSDGQNLRKVSPDSVDFNPIRGISWSPDRTRLAFSGETLDDEKHIYVVVANGTGFQKLTGGDDLISGGDSEDPQWSPDGSKILFRFGWSGGIIRPPETPWVGLYTINPDGTGLSPIITPQTAGIDYKSISYARWSPSGDKIVFEATDPSTYDSAWSETRYRLFAVNSDGSNIIQLTSGNNSLSPEWSPDGTKISFLGSNFVDSDGQRYYQVSVYTMNPDGTQKEVVDILGPKLARSAGIQDKDVPRWSPDSTKLLYRAGWNYPRDLHVINRDGSDKTFLLEGNRVSGYSWSPNGDKIAYLASDPTGESSSLLVIMNPDGSEKNDITPDFGISASSGGWISWFEHSYP